MIGVGVIGYGYWGPNLVRNFSQLDDVQLVGVADKRAEILERVGGKYPHLKLTSDYEELLNNPKIDALAIATPVSTHYPIAKDVLSKGKHVLVEKPLTVSSQEAWELVRLSEKNKRVLMVDHTFIYTSAVQKIKDLLLSGELGDIYYLDSVRVNLGLFQHDINVLWDLAPHDISIMDYLFDKLPEEVNAVGISHIGNALENTAHLHFYYPSGETAHVHVSWLAPVKIRLMLIGGSKKMVVYNDLEPSEKIKVYDKGITLIKDEKNLHKALVDYRIGDMYSPHLEPTEALHRVCSHFVSCILRGETPITDGEAGARVVKILEACKRSISNQGERVKL